MLENRRVMTSLIPAAAKATTQRVYYLKLSVAVHPLSWCNFEWWLQQIVKCKQHHSKSVYKMLIFVFTRVLVCSKCRHFSLSQTISSVNNNYVSCVCVHWHTRHIQQPPRCTAHGIISYNEILARFGCLGVSRGCE